MGPLGGGEGGDRQEAWRQSYLGGRKDPFVAQAASNRRRLDAMGVPAALRGRWLDLGAGDGNLSSVLAARGAELVAAVEYQPELLAAVRSAPTDPVHPVLGDAVALPVCSGSIESVVVMDVLHHLAPEQLEPCLGELARVLRPGGALYVCEPSPTMVRSVLQRLLDSPLGTLTSFSRRKRTMVELEADTLFPWLAREPGAPAMIADAGFRLEHTTRRPLHTLRRFRRHDDRP